jgi:hypothetical protein
MSTRSQIASKEGYKFEAELINTLKEHFSDFIICREKDIIKEYGIDIEIFDPLS